MFPSTAAPAPSSLRSALRQAAELTVAFATLESYTLDDVLPARRSDAPALGAITDGDLRSAAAANGYPVDDTDRPARHLSLVGADDDLPGKAPFVTSPSARDAASVTLSSPPAANPAPRPPSELLAQASAARSARQAAAPDPTPTRTTGLKTTAEPTLTRTARQAAAPQRPATDTTSAPYGTSRHAALLGELLTWSIAAQPTDRTPRPTAAAAVPPPTAPAPASTPAHDAASRTPRAAAPTNFSSRRPPHGTSKTPGAQRRRGTQRPATQQLSLLPA